MHEVSIRFQAEVTRAYQHGDSYALTLKIDGGSKYGGRADVWSDLPVSVGDTVEVTTSQMPYAKTREYTNRDGDTKTATDIVYRGTVNVVSRSTSAAERVAADLGGELSDEEIPFAFLPRERWHTEAGHWQRPRAGAAW